MNKRDTKPQNAKKKRVIPAVAVILLLAAVLAVILWPSAAISREDFTARMEEQGFTVTEADSNLFSVPDVEGELLVAANDDYMVCLEICRSGGDAGTVFNYVKHIWLEGATQEAVIRSDRSVFELQHDGTYYMACRRGKTLLLTMAPQACRDEIEAIRESLVG